MKRLMSALTVMLVLLVLASGCRSITGKSLGENVDDSRITAQVKAGLVADRARNLTAVDVDSNQGVVYLTGNVGTPEQKQAAERIAREATGVRGVVNNLRVESAAFRETPAGARSGKQTSGVAASPATAPAAGRHSTTGEVTGLDRGRGRLQLRTDQGQMELYFPPAALRNVQEGDRVTIDMSMRPAR